MDEFACTVIIPARNCPELLQRCLDSIPCRDDIQTVVVDDNSSPDAVDFDTYPGLGRAGTEVVFDRVGAGAGHARNIGLGKARGRWLVFADADDRFITDAFSRALDEYRDSDADIVFCNALRIDAGTGSIVREQIDADRWRRCPARYADRLRYRSNAPWAKFVRRSMVEANGLRFSEVPRANDLLFSTKVGYYAARVEVDLSCIYEWYIRREGNLSSRSTVAAVDYVLDEECRRNDFLVSKGKGRYRSNLYIELYDKYLQAGLGGMEAVRRISARMKPAARVAPFCSFVLYRFVKWVKK